MIKMDGLVAFTAITEAGSISGAARRLGFAKSVVSERLAELERTLGTRLIQRTTRKLALTEDGHSFLPRAQQILYQTREAAAEMAQRHGTLAGPLRVSGPVGFGVLHLGPALNDFLRAHPEIDLTLELDDGFVDAAASGFDAVIRHGPIGDTRLVAKRLATTRRLLVASPGYLAEQGRPATLAELAAHRGILYANRDADWRFAGAEGWMVLRPRAALRVNNGLVMRDAALAGLGITLLPTFFVHEQLASGALVEVDIGMAAEGAELFIAYPRDRSASAKIAALTASLRRSFGDPPYWDR
ncbi:MAG: LysR family transcriptional regulator [Candidatus Sphingomonas phytovorans]|nr:LysR family transcriptional regulator [Sphingomonas sp.]WEJ98017.1 MAG: LysR family transcriptional regulator [Sphingomonas sp.]